MPEKKEKDDCMTYSEMIIKHLFSVT